MQIYNMINCTKRRNVSKLYTNMHKKTYLYKNLTLYKQKTLKTVQKVCTKETYLYKNLTCAKKISLKTVQKVCTKKNCTRHIPVQKNNMCKKCLKTVQKNMCKNNLYKSPVQKLNRYKKVIRTKICTSNDVQGFVSDVALMKAASQATGSQTDSDERCLCLHLSLQSKKL